MTDSGRIYLETEHNPTVFNGEAVTGAALGAAAVAAAGLFLAIPVTMPLAVGAALVGGLAGGLGGKRRMERENAQGKEVGEPSKWNRQGVAGAVIGLGAGCLVSLGLCAVAASATVPAIAILAGLAAWATPVIGLIDGAKVGSRLGMQAQQAEYDQATAQQHARDRGEWQHPIPPDMDPDFNNLNDKLPKKGKDARGR